MSEQRSFASLTGSLLARKGSARPAMRSPLNLRGGHAPLGTSGLSAPEADDLGWNDMHGETASVEPARVETGFAPAASPAVFNAPSSPAPGPSVVALQQAISARLAMVADREETARAAPVLPVAPNPAPTSAVQPAQAAKAGRRRSALADGRRAAFTLRIDAERHLKLRLACTLHNRSAQMLVIDALDRLFAEEPALAVLAAQMSSKA